jgi:hypothetical protein
MRPRLATVEDLAGILWLAWSKATSSLWTAENPARGQCGVTSLVVQDLFGGEILCTPTPEGTHFYNRVDGQRLDFTASQFVDQMSYDDVPVGRDQAMANTSAAQYHALRLALGLAVNN